MSLERHNEISPAAAEQHSITVFTEVFAKMQAAVSVKAKKVPGDFIQFTNIYGARETKIKSATGEDSTPKESSSVLQQQHGRQFVINADGSILLNCYTVDDGFPL
jgi:hypothetical protein